MLKLEEVDVWRKPLQGLLGLDEASVLGWQNKNPVRKSANVTVDGLYALLGEPLCGRVAKWLAGEAKLFNYNPHPPGCV